MTDRQNRRESRNAAFTAFYLRHHRQVYAGLALTLHDADLAAEATQEAMIRACHHWSVIDERRNPAGWLYRVGLNFARSHLRRMRRMSLGTAVDRGELDEGGISGGQLDDALRLLPVHLRAVVVLRFFLDWSVQDVADALDIKPGTVRSRQHRALEVLRTNLEEHDGSRDKAARDAR